MTASRSITHALADAETGSMHSLDALVPLVYAELRALAASYLRGNPGHTLQPTALVHEAFVKLTANDHRWSGRDHFKAVAAKAMRQVLVDHARARNADKRGGSRSRADISIDGLAADPHKSHAMQVEELDRLLTDLAALSPRAAHVAELHLFGGLDSAQISRVIGGSAKTSQRDWQFARAWLAGRMMELSDAR